MNTCREMVSTTITIEKKTVCFFFANDPFVYISSRFLFADSDNVGRAISSVKDLKQREVGDIAPRVARSSVTHYSNTEKNASRKRVFFPIFPEKTSCREQCNQ